MSGLKRAMVTISEEEYKKLHEADLEKRFKESKPVFIAHTASVNSSLRVDLDQLQTRQAEFDRMISGMGDQLHSFETETANAFISEKEAFYDALASQVGDIWENSARLEGLFRTFEEEYRLDSQRINQHLESTQRQLNRLYKNQNRKNEIVLPWLSAASNLGEYIVNEYQHEKFAPGRVDKIYQQLALAQNNYYRGMPEAALSTVQQAYLQFSELRLELEQKTLEWQALFNVTWQAAHNLLELLRANSSCPALDMDGQELPVNLMLNFWSNGQYNELGQRLKGLINCLKREKLKLSHQQLTVMLRKELPSIMNEFNTIIYQARFAAINSQLRINIADIALQALKAQGFVEETFGYEADDMRSPFYLRMKNIEGSQVTIWVSPINNNENKNDLMVESQDSEERTEYELRQRSNEIINSLLQYGLRVANLEAQNVSQQNVYEMPLAQTQVSQNIVLPRV